MRIMPISTVRFVVMTAAIVAALVSSGYSTDRGTPYASALSDASRGGNEALPRSCKETLCSQQSDGTFVCHKVNSSPNACKVGQGKTTCTNVPC